MNILDMKKKDFKKVPFRKINEEIDNIYSLVIIGTKVIHNSGYRYMEFVAIDAKGEPICRMSGVSEVLHINGISGYGDYMEPISDFVKRICWKIDCLPCGYLRLFTGKRLKVSGYAVSNFSIYEVDD